MFPLDDRATLITAPTTGSARGVAFEQRTPPVRSHQEPNLLHRFGRRAGLRGGPFGPDRCCAGRSGRHHRPVAGRRVQRRGRLRCPGVGHSQGPTSPSSTRPRAQPGAGLPSLFLDPPDAAAVGGLSAADGSTSARLRINRVDADHPILAGVSLLGLPATISARALDPRCKPLAAAGNLTAIAVCDPANSASPPLSSSPDPALPNLTTRSIVVAFDLDLSPLAQRPDLAALLQNTTEWLSNGHTNFDETSPVGLQNERATRLNDSNLAPSPPGRFAELTQQTRRLWSWRTLVLAGLLLASLEAITFFRGITV